MSDADIIKSDEAVSAPVSDQSEPQPKLFTQEEVNNIVKKRLYERKAEQKANEDIIEERVSSAIAERTSALEARERRLECRSYLIDNNYPADLLDILDTSDVEVFKSKADTLQQLVGRSVSSYPVVKDGGENRPMDTTSQRVKNAFLNTAAHQPKKTNY